jgi:chromosomal replication initiation ATPase DnaA
MTTGKNKKIHLKLKVLATAAARYYNVPISRLLGKSKCAVYARPRHICMWVSKNAGYDSIDVAKFWCLHKSTIYAGSQQVQLRLVGNAKVQADLRRFLVYLTAYMKDPSSAKK